MDIFFSYQNYLFYKDKITGEAGPVCNKPECMHNDNSCNAFLTDELMRFLINYSEDIYYIANEFIPEQESSYDILYQMITDGGRKKILIFSEPIYYIAFHRGYIYYITTDYGTISGKENETCTTMSFYKIPIDKPQANPELLYEFQGIYANAGRLLCYGNNIYFLQSAFADASMEQFDMQINHYNIADGTITTMIPDCYALYTIFNDKFAFIDQEGTYICDLDGQNIQKVCDQWGILSANEKCLLIDTACTVDVMHGVLSRTITAVDMEGHCTGNIELNGFRLNPIGIVDDMYLVPDFKESTQHMTIYQIPADKIADGTGQPEVFFEYVPEEWGLWE